MLGRPRLYFSIVTIDAHIAVIKQLHTASPMCVNSTEHIIGIVYTEAIRAMENVILNYRTLISPRAHVAHHYVCASSRRLVVTRSLVSRVH
jgi:hypothetical protein